MPTEYREIIFTQAEVADAIQRYLTSQNPDAPRIAPGGVNLSADPEEPVSVRLGEERRGFSGTEVTAALILHAKRLGVPIARKSRKAIAAANGSIKLRLWLD